MRLPSTAVAQKDRKIAKTMRKNGFELDGKRLIKVDSITSVYVPKDATQAEINAIVEQVRRKIIDQKLPLNGYLNV